MPRRELKVGMSSAVNQKPISISKLDWERIEREYRATIGLELRERIERATQEFALSAIVEVRAPSIEDARKATKELLSIGNTFLNALKVEPVKLNGRFYAFHLVRNHLRDERLGDYTAFPGPIAALRNVLNSFVSACEQRLTELRDPNRAEFLMGAAWDAWICELSSGGPYRYRTAAILFPFKR